jgi:hypothetical protein
MNELSLTKVHRRRLLTQVNPLHPDEHDTEDCDS